jgi:MoaA/NifB/PqqE/SkfB family radical SAM enzyme
MNPKKQTIAQVDDQGHLIIPAEIALRYNLIPGTQVAIESSANEFHVLRPVSHLAKLYIEPTSICNLDCVTCMRNVWNEELGRMSETTFQRVLDSIKAMNPLPVVFFGGFGEPLAHPQLIDMVRAVKALGATVEMITNGILLDERRSLELVRAGLDFLWVSLDGASPESYADVRLGSSLPRVIENLRRLRTLRGRAGYNHDHKPHLGIAFVAMKRNISDLPALLRLGVSLGARRFSVSNVVAHTDDLHAESLYTESLRNSVNIVATEQPVVNLPRIDINGITLEPVGEVWKRKMVLQIAGKDVNRTIDSCQFIEQGVTAVRWDGGMSPCLPLLHSHDSYFGKYTHHTHDHIVGNVNDRTILEIWNDLEYSRLRQRVQQFDFSPCVSCTGCELSRENRADCIDSPFPTCGRCLWAQGLIQCP